MPRAVCMPTLAWALSCVWGPLGPLPEQTQLTKRRLGREAAGGSHCSCWQFLARKTTGRPGILHPLLTFSRTSVLSWNMSRLARTYLHCCAVKKYFQRNLFFSITVVFSAVRQLLHSKCSLSSSLQILSSTSQPGDVAFPVTIVHAVSILQQMPAIVLYSQCNGRWLARSASIKGITHQCEFSVQKLHQVSNVSTKTVLWCSRNVTSIKPIFCQWKCMMLSQA